MKQIALLGIAVIGLLSLSLIHNASANEAAFRAAAEKAWQEIQAHDATLPVIPTPNGTDYSINATSANATSDSNSSAVPIIH